MTYLGLFVTSKVYETHNCIIEDANGNKRRLHHNRLHPCRAQEAQLWITMVFPKFQKL